LIVSKDQDLGESLIEKEAFADIVADNHSWVDVD
jgi:hypothetical protein